MKKYIKKSILCRSNPNGTGIITRLLVLFVVAATVYGMTTLTSSCANKDPGSIKDETTLDDGCTRANQCLDKDSKCQTVSAQNCGKDGGTCTTCATGKVCSNGSCSDPVSGKDPFNPDGNVNGSPDGTPNAGDCDGCLANGACVRSTDTQCGSNGSGCTDCTELEGNKVCRAGSCQESFDDKTYKITVQARADKDCDLVSLPLASNGCDPQVQLKSDNTTVTPWDESKNEKSESDSIRFNNIRPELTNPTKGVAGFFTDFSDHYWCLKGADISSENLKITVSEAEFKVSAGIVSGDLELINEDTCDVIVGQDSNNNPTISSVISCSGKEEVTSIIKLNVTQSDCTP